MNCTRNAARIDSHGVESIVAEPIQHYPACEDRAKFFSREIRVTRLDGSIVVLTLFADDANALRIAEALTDAEQAQQAEVRS